MKEVESIRRLSVHQNNYPETSLYHTCLNIYDKNSNYIPRNYILRIHITNTTTHERQLAMNSIYNRTMWEKKVYKKKNMKNLKKNSDD